MEHRDTEEVRRLSGTGATVCYEGRVGKVSSQLAIVYWYVNEAGDARLRLTRSGNLPTEKVTKRDLFHVFHKYGPLAQVSIKQAYGFVQFLIAQDCLRALDTEQGVSIRGRKIRKSGRQQCRSLVLIDV